MVSIIIYMVSIQVFQQNHIRAFCVRTNFHKSNKADIPVIKLVIDLFGFYSYCFKCFSLGFDN